MEHRATARRPLIVVLALLCAAVATPCSFDMEPILFYDVRPDAPIERYVDGRLGILQPSYARSHLVVAFRYLSGKPPSAIEREGFRELLRHRLHEKSGPPVLAAEQWEKLRTLIRGVEFKQAPDQSRMLDVGDEYFWIENCNDDAFATAAATLAARVKTFGAAHPAVKAWLDAQEVVFSNCSEGNASVPEADAALPALIRQDRAYQIAAADFYAMRYDDARERFLAIADDAQSPWRQTARLVAARTLMRAATLDAAIADDDPLATAANELRAILMDASMAPLHEVAWGLLNFAVAKRDPQKRFDEAAHDLVAGANTARRARTDLADYTILWEHENVTGKDELSDWIRTFQTGDLAHALERWTATKRMHWLIAALTHVKADDAAARALLDATKNIAADSPAAVHVAYHRARLLSDPDAVRAELDRVLARNDVPRSARNQLLARRRGLARSLAEFLRDAPVRTVGSGPDAQSDAEAETLLPVDAAAVFNHHMPLAMMRAAAQDASLTEDIRAELQRAVDTRAALLDPAADKFTLAYDLARDPHRSPYALPMHQIYSRGNWWCPRAADIPPPPFLTADNPEHDALIELGSGGAWILRQTMARAKSHRDDPRVPEALSLAIRATRKTCSDRDTDALAEKAFALLHRRYGKTKWAEETEYWYRSDS